MVAGVRGRRGGVAVPVGVPARRCDAIAVVRRRLVMVRVGRQTRDANALRGMRLEAWR